MSNSISFPSTIYKSLDHIEDGIHYEVYSDNQGNKFCYEDGELKFTEIYNEEQSYDMEISIEQNSSKANQKPLIKSFNEWICDIRLNV